MFNPELPYNDLQKLMPDFDFDDKDILKVLGETKEALAELKGISYLFDKKISTTLLMPLTTKEAVSSSNIENIHSTLTDTLEAEILSNTEIRLPEKETLSYRDSLVYGFNQILKNDFKLSLEILEELQKKILITDKKLKSGFRKKRNDGILRIKNHSTDEIIYTPPNDDKIILELIEDFIYNFNNDKNQNVDPLIKIALLHYQFEAIHPFEDGNGRVGRILLVLSFLINKKLDIPVLYISDYLLKNKSDYYRLLKEVTSKNNWKDFIIFILLGIKIQSRHTKVVFENIKQFMDDSEKILKENKINIKISDIILKPFYSVADLSKQAEISRITSTKYLKKLTDIGYLQVFRAGKEKIYFSKKYLDILSAKY
jgi:Fic family protein